IEEDHVGVRAASLEDRLAPGARLTDGLDVRLRGRQQPDPGADDRMVVDDQDANRAGHLVPDLNRSLRVLIRENPQAICAWHTMGWPSTRTTVRAWESSYR